MAAFLFLVQREQARPPTRAPSIATFPQRLVQRVARAVPGLMRFEFGADWRIVRCSQSAAALFSSTPAALQGRRIWDLMPPGTILAPMGIAIREVIATQQARTVCVPSILRPGTHLWARISPRPGGGVRLVQRFLVSAREVAQYAQTIVAALMPGLALVVT